MGQQQLLLLVLTVVITGLAVASGIDAFSENQLRARIDNMRVAATGIAQDVIAWKAKPGAIGGGQEVAYLTGLTMEQMGYTTDGRSGLYTSDSYEAFIASSHRGGNGAHINVLERVNGRRGDIGVQIRVFGATVDCIQLTLQWRNGVLGSTGYSDSGFTQGGGSTWIKNEPSWDDSGNVPSSCPTAW